MLSENDIQKIKESILLTHFTGGYVLTKCNRDIYIIIDGVAFPRNVFLYWFSLLKLFDGVMHPIKTQVNYIKEQMGAFYSELDLSNPLNLRDDSNKKINLCNLQVTQMSSKEEKFFEKYINIIVNVVCERHKDKLEYFSSMPEYKAECALYFLEKECEELLENNESC